MSRSVKEALQAVYDLGRSPHSKLGLMNWKPMWNEVCDDCGKEYPGPAYYVFEADGCMSGTDELHVPCTGNLCPSCAWDLVPDDTTDPRWEIDTVYKAEMAAALNGIKI